MSIISCAWFEPLVKVAVARSLHRTFVWGDDSPASHFFAQLANEALTSPREVWIADSLGRWRQFFPCSQG